MADQARACEPYPITAIFIFIFLYDPTNFDLSSCRESIVFKRLHKFLWRGKTFDTIPGHFQEINGLEPFTTTLVIDGQALLLSSHMERFFRAINLAGSSVSHSDFDHAFHGIEGTLAQARSGRLRMTFLKEEILISLGEVGDDQDLNRFYLLKDSRYPLDSLEINRDLKYVDYDHRRELARGAGVPSDKVIWLDSRGTFLESTYRNLVFKIDETFVFSPERPGVFWQLSQKYLKLYLTEIGLEWDESLVRLSEMETVSVAATLNSYRLFEPILSIAEHTFQDCEDWRRMGQRYKEWLMHQS